MMRWITSGLRVCPSGLTLRLAWLLRLAERLFDCLLDLLF